MSVPARRRSSPSRIPVIRKAPIDPIITIPAITPRRWILRRMSPFRMWLNSCATDPLELVPLSCSSVPASR